MRNFNFGGDGGNLEVTKYELPIFFLSYRGYFEIMKSKVKEIHPNYPSLGVNWGV